MALIKGILSFSSIFTATIAKGSSEPKFTAMVIMPSNDPQVPALLAEVNAAKLNTYPSGLPANSNICFDLYEKKVTPDKDYHDPRLVGWYAFTCSAKADDKPAIVDMAHVPIIDPSQVFSGMNVFVSAGISGYVKGTGGIGGWLNGVMSTGELGQLGRLDGKPSIEQMFAAAGNAAAPAPAPASELLMTAAANGVTYQQYMATPGWTDEMLIAQGLAIKPSFA